MKNKRSNWKVAITVGENVRSQIVTPEMIGTEICVYDGKKFKTIEIKLRHIGHKIGEFVQSKLIYKKEHGKKVKN